LQSARYLQNRLAPLNAALSRESPAALKYALSMLGFMRPSTRLPIVELAEPAKAEVARAIAEIGDEDLACPGKSGHRPRCGRIRPTASLRATGGCAVEKMLLPPFRPGTAHIVIFGVIFPDRPAPGRTEKRHQSAGSAAEMGRKLSHVILHAKSRHQGLQAD
jgi:hypothetical protein